MNHAPEILAGRIRLAFAAFLALFPSQLFAPHSLYRRPWPACIKPVSHQLWPSPTTLAQTWYKLSRGKPIHANRAKLTLSARPVAGTMPRDGRSRSTHVTYDTTTLSILPRSARPCIMPTQNRAKSGLPLCRFEVAQTL